MMANNDLDAEKMNEEQESQQSKSRSGGNFADRMANDLNDFSQKATDIGNKLGEKATQKARFAAQNEGAKSIKATQQAKKLQEASGKALKVAAKAEKFAKVAAFIGKIISIVGLIILVVMIVVGLIVFINTGWGMLLSNFKEIGEKLWNTLNGFLNGKETNIKEDEIINLMDNIETMGYDLYGYGFVASQGEGTDTKVKHKQVSVPSGFSKEEVTVEMDNIQNEYNIAWISDLHMMDMSDVDVNAKAFGGNQANVDLRYNQMFQNSINFFDDIINCLTENYKSGNIDAVVFGGDIMDNYGSNTYSKLNNGLSKLKNEGVPFMFLTADHDYLTELTKSSGEKTDANGLDGLTANGNIKTLTLGDNEESITLIGQAFSNKSGNFSDGALSSALSNASENALYFTHVPIESKNQATEMQSWCKSVHNDNVYYWSSKSSNYDINSISSYANTLYNSKIKGVFAGHVHTSSKSQNFKFTDNAIEHVFSASYNKNIGVITVTPSSGSEGKYYDENGLLESLKQKGAYRYLTTYLISDNYAYYIKNHNLNFKTMTSDTKNFFKRGIGCYLLGIWLN